jgi:hypothetical protein
MDFCLFKAGQSNETLKVPIKVDEITILEDITCSEGVPSSLEFQYEITQYINKESVISADSYMKKNVYPLLNKTWCTNPTYYQNIEFFDVEFIYKDLNAKEISRHKITLQDCMAFIKK